MHENTSLVFFYLSFNKDAERKKVQEERRKSFAHFIDQYRPSLKAHVGNDDAYEQSQHNVQVSYTFHLHHTRSQQFAEMVHSEPQIDLNACT